MGDGASATYADVCQREYQKALRVVQISCQSIQIARHQRTVVFKQFVLIAALPEDTALLRTHHFPRPKVNDPFVGGVLEEYSVTLASVT